MDFKVSSTKRERIIWILLKTEESEKTIDPDKWETFDDIDNDLIESAYQQKLDWFELDHCWIDLADKIIINKHDPDQRQAIERISDTSEYRLFKRARFINEHAVTLTLKSFRPSWTWFPSLIKMKYPEQKEKLPEFIEAAASGVEKEGAEFGNRIQAKKISETLRMLTNQDEKALLRTCANLYTKESFLYKLINKFLRETEVDEGDGSPIQRKFISERDEVYTQALGPFCCLLQKYIDENNQIAKPIDIIYRSAQLTDEMIEDYKNNIGENVWWHSFVSTSKNINVALFYDQNTLFVIDCSMCLYACSDLSFVSQFPEEEEILLRAGTYMRIDEVRYDDEIKKYVIRLWMRT